MTELVVVCCRRSGFGQPIAFVDRKAQTLLPLTSHLSRHTGRRRETVPHRRESLLHTRCIQHHNVYGCLFYTSDAADDLTRVDLGGRRIIKKKKTKKKKQTIIQ